MLKISDHGGNFGGGGSKSDLNIFIQETQPKGFKGLWIQGNQKPKDIISNTNQWKISERNTLLNPSPTVLIDTHAVALGKDIYVGSNETYSKIYKYNTLTNIWNQITELPYAAVNRPFGFCSDDERFLYVLGGGSNSTTMVAFYRYDTVLNTWEKLANSPYTSYYASLVFKDNKIYHLINGQSRSSCVYDIATGVWAILDAPPNSGTKVNNTFIYKNKIYTSTLNSLDVYDIDSNKWTEAPQPPISGIYSRSAKTIIGDRIYFIYATETCVYDISNNSWTIDKSTNMNNIHDTLNVPAHARIDNVLYIMSSSSTGEMGSFEITQLLLEDGTIIALYSKNPSYNNISIELFNRKYTTELNTLLYDLWLVENGKINTNPTTKTGNGMEWNNL